MQSFGVLLSNGGDVTGDAQPWNGGRGVFSVVGDFDGGGGGSVTLEYLGPDGVTWLIVPDDNGGDIVLTASGASIFDLPPGQIRVALDLMIETYARADRVPR
jgi:hypothetical protein